MNIISRLIVLVLVAITCSSYSTNNNVGLMMVVSAQSCSSLPVLTFQVEQYCTFTLLTFTNSHLFESVNIAPPPDSYSFGGPSGDQFQLANKSYQFHYRNGTCDGYVSYNSTVPMPSRADQPLCYNSQYLVYLNVPSVRSAKIDNGVAVSNQSSPLVITNSFDNRNFITLSNDLSLYCPFTLDSIPQQAYRPKLVITPARCNKGGSLVVIDDMNYNSFMLVFPNGTNITTVDGVFNNLPTNQGYQVILKSTTCGTQVVGFDILYDQFTLTPVFTPLVGCPSSKINVSFHADGIPDNQLSGTFIVSTYNIQAGVSVVLDQLTSYSVTYSAPGCPYSGNFNTPRSIPPLSHEVTYQTHPINQCGDLVNITITDQRGNYSALTIIDEASSNQIPFDIDTHSFTATYPNRYQLKATDCPFFSYGIAFDRVAPKYSYTLSGTNCYDNVTLTIENYFLFKQPIQVSVSSLGLNVQSYDGVFHLPTSQSYGITYTELGCSTPQQSTITLSQQIDMNPPYHYSTEILQYPKCFSADLGQAILTVEFDGRPELKVNSYFLFTAIEDVRVVPLQYQQCQVIVKWDIPKQVDWSLAQVQVIKPATCLYSTDALVYIKFPGNLNPIIYVDGQEYNSIRGNYTLYQVPGGSKVKFSSYFQSCPLSSAVILTEYLLDIPISYPSFSPQYNITNQNSTCTIPSGGITVTNSSQYTTLKLSGTNMVNGTRMGIGGGIYSLQFSINLGPNETCAGSLPIDIKSDPNVYGVFTQELRVPTCRSDVNGDVVGDGSIYYYIYDQSLDAIPYDQYTINSLDFGFEEPRGRINKIPSDLPNRLELQLQDYCSFSLDITMKQPSSPVIQSVTMDTFPTCEKDGTATIQLNKTLMYTTVFNSLLITSDVGIPYIDFNTSQILSSTFRIAGIAPGATFLNFNLNYSDNICSKLYYFTIPEYDPIPVTPPTVQYVPMECGHLYFGLQFDPTYLNNYDVRVNGKNPALSQNGLITMTRDHKNWDIIYGSKLYPQCNGKMTIIPPYTREYVFNSTYLPSNLYSTYNETCLGSGNGGITSNDPDIFISSYKSNIGPDYTIPLNSLGYGRYQVMFSNTSNQLCYQVSSINIGANEPNLVVDKECHGDKSDVSIDLNSGRFSGVYLVLNNVTRYNDTFIENLPDGMYQVNVTIGDPICPRTNLLKTFSLSCSVESPNGNEKKSKTGLIVGVIFGILGAVFIGLLILYIYKRHKKNKKKGENVKMDGL